MDPNPYTTPASNVFGSSSATPSDGVTDGTLHQLKGTQGWVKLVAVICYLGTALMFLLGLAMAFSGTFAAAALGSATGGTELGGAMGVGVGILYALLGLIYLYPGKKLWNYGTRIQQLLQDRSTVTLEAALNEQRAFWKFIGILTILMLSLYALIIIGAILFAGFFAAAAANAGG